MYINVEMKINPMKITSKSYENDIELEVIGFKIIDCHGKVMRI